MAEAVVYRLEPVKVQAKHSDALAARQPLQRLLQLLLEQGPVGEVGQRIMTGEMDNFLFLAVPFGHVLVQGYPATTLEGLA